MSIERADDDAQDNVPMEASEPDVDPALRAIVAAIKAQCQLARMLGFIVTVETVPKQPLAMGNYEGRIEVRPAKELYRS